MRNCLYMEILPFLVTDCFEVFVFFLIERFGDGEVFEGKRE